MFTDFVVQPIFNLLVVIYSLLPGHNFGLALVIFTIVIRLALWPLVKKQLHQTKAMRKLAPELKKIKDATKGDRQKASLMTMELYKEQGINPFGTIPILIVQGIVLFGLYFGLSRVISDPRSLISFAYPAVQNLSWIQNLSANIHLFDNTLFGVVDLSRKAFDKGAIYWPAMLIVIASAVAQFYQAKQLMPSPKDKRGLRAILREAGNGQQADQSEISAAVGSSTKYMLPVIILTTSIHFASALALYWLISGLVALIQQNIILGKDETEMEAIADNTKSKDLKSIPEAEIITKSKNSQKPSPKNKKRTKKRRR